MAVFWLENAQRATARLERKGAALREARWGIDDLRFGLGEILSMSDGGQKQAAFDLLKKDAREMVVCLQAKVFLSGFRRDDDKVALLVVVGSLLAILILKEMWG